MELKVGGYAIIDLKTQDVKRDKQGFPKWMICQHLDCFLSLCRVWSHPANVVAA